MNATLPKIIRDNSLKWPHNTAICRKEYGIWHKISWYEYYQTIKFLSLGLVCLGLRQREVVCIIGDNEPQWFFGEFAVQAAGGIPTGIFVDSIAAEVKYIASLSNAKFAIVNDQEQADKFIEIYDELNLIEETSTVNGNTCQKKIPQIKKIIYWDSKGLKNYNHPALISFSEVIELGKKYEIESPRIFEETMDNCLEDDIAFIYYTSGTTGLPKGAMLSHKALINTAFAFISIYPLTRNDNLISNFPAAWVGDSYFATIPHLLTGAVLNFAEEPDTIATDTREAGPDFVIYGPRQWESIVSDIQVKITDAHPVKRFFYKLFMPVGYKIADLKFANDRINIFWKLLYKVAYFLLFRPLKDKIGLSEVKFAVTGSSVLSLDTFRLIHALGIELRQSYASTEAGFISSHSKNEIDFQSVGRPAPGTEIRLTKDDELLVRSNCLFKEYYKNTEKTSAVLVDGWCKTGDAVNINDEGHLIFLDRLEHLGSLASGTKYAPQYIEGRLRFSPYIKDAMVIGGSNREFVTAIINIDFAMVSKWAERSHLTFTTFVDLSQKDQVAMLIKKDLVRVNGYLPVAARVEKFVLLHKEFDADEAELTRTKKLRREYIEKRYTDLIEAMYAGLASITTEASVTYRDGRKGVVSTSLKIRTT